MILTERYKLQQLLTLQQKFLLQEADDQSSSQQQSAQTQPTAIADATSQAISNIKGQLFDEKTGQIKPNTITIGEKILQSASPQARKKLLQMNKELTATSAAIRNLLQSNQFKEISQVIKELDVRNQTAAWWKLLKQQAVGASPQPDATKATPKIRGTAQSFINSLVKRIDSLKLPTLDQISLQVSNQFTTLLDLLNQLGDQLAIISQKLAGSSSSDQRLDSLQAIEALLKQIRELRILQKVFVDWVAKDGFMATEIVPQDSPVHTTAQSLFQVGGGADGQTTVYQLLKTIDDASKAAKELIPRLKKLLAQGMPTDQLQKLISQIYSSKNPDDPRRVALLIMRKDFQDAFMQSISDVAPATSGTANYQKAVIQLYTKICDWVKSAVSLTQKRTDTAQLETIATSFENAPKQAAFKTVFSMLSAAKKSITALPTSEWDQKYAQMRSKQTRTGTKVRQDGNGVSHVVRGDYAAMQNGFWLKALGKNGIFGNARDAQKARHLGQPLKVELDYYGFNTTQNPILSFLTANNNQMLRMASAHSKNYQAFHNLIVDNYITQDMLRGRDVKDQNGQVWPARQLPIYNQSIWKLPKDQFSDYIKLASDLVKRVKNKTLTVPVAKEMLYTDQSGTKFRDPAVARVRLQQLTGKKSGGNSNRTTAGSTGQSGKPKGVDKKQAQSAVDIILNGTYAGAQDKKQAAETLISLITNKKINGETISKDQLIKILTTGDLI